MLIVCPNCETSYDIPTAKLGVGRKVRCARCQQQWFAAMPQPALAIVGAGGPEHEVSSPSFATDAMADKSDLPAQAVDAPPLAPTDDIDAPPPRGSVEPDPSEDIETVAARRVRIARSAERRRKRRPSLPLIIFALMTVLAVLIAARAPIVRAAPQTASLYAAIGFDVNLRGLTFENVKTLEEVHEGVPVLVVEGSIANVAKTAMEIPRLRFAVRNAAGMEIYAWTALPTQPRLPTGETLPFRSRLASPPAGSHDVMVRFFHRRDRGAGR